MNVVKVRRLHQADLPQDGGACWLAELKTQKDSEVVFESYLSERTKTVFDCVQTIVEHTKFSTDEYAYFC